MTTPSGTETFTTSYRLVLFENETCTFRNIEDSSVYTGTYTKTGETYSISGLVDENGTQIVGGKDTTPSQGTSVSFIKDGGFEATLIAGAFTPISE